MKTRNAFPLTAIAAALLAAFPMSHAAEGDDVEDLARPGSTTSAGIGLVSRDNQRFGQYTGLREEGVYGIMNIDYADRDDGTGTWTKLTARNLGLPDREFRFEQQRQGEWGYFLENSQIPRYNPYVVNTRLTGIGDSSQTVNGSATPQDVQLKTVRDNLGLGFDKALGSGLALQLRFRNEDKEGARQFGQGTNPGTPTVNFLTDPINQTTRQLEAILNYTGERLQLAGGYYATEFQNNNNRIDVTGGIANFTPIALPPGNKSQQLYLSGGYSIDPVTRATFKFASTRQRQDESFVAPTATGRTGLGAQVDTTLALLGVTSRPLAKLSLNANLRYEDRKDKTPVARYFTGAGATSTLDGSNEPRSLNTMSGKAEASYALPMGFRLTGGYDWEVKKRNVIAVRAVSFREETDEQSYRAELRRSLSETVTGALSYVHSDRDGSPFLTTTLNPPTGSPPPGAVGSNLVAPLHLADRKRDKKRLSVNWQAAERLSMQFFVDDARDTYSGDGVRTLGPMKGKAQNYSVDAAYAVTDAWQATAWVSRNDNRAEQQTQAGAPTGQFWKADLRNLSDSAGLGLRGKATPRLEVGVDFQTSSITDEYRLEAVTGAPIASPTDISTKLRTLKAFTSYAIDKSAAVRVDYIYDSFKTDDWTWANWVYSDGTRVIQSPDQKVHFVGVSYHVRWR